MTADSYNYAWSRKNLIISIFCIGLIVGYNYLGLYKPEIIT